MLWCHDAFQFALNPLATLKRWNENMNVNGMMVLSLPQQQVYEYNRLVTRSYNGMYHNYNVCNLMYMLAVNGFDCRDSYILKEENVPWITMAVYKSDVAPMAPENTTWYDLADCNLINDSVIDCLNKFGHVRQEMLLFNWLDKNFVFAKD
jgi:hypothetical protein